MPDPGADATTGVVDSPLSVFLSKDGDERRTTRVPVSVDGRPVATVERAVDPGFTGGVETAVVVESARTRTLQVGAVPSVAVPVADPAAGEEPTDGGTETTGTGCVPTTTQGGRTTGSGPDRRRH